MNTIFAIMIILGGFTYLVMGFSLIKFDKIKYKKSDKIVNTIATILVISLIVCIIGFFGLLTNNL